MDDLGMDVIVVQENGDQLLLRVKKKDTVRKMKTQIEIQSRIPKPYQRLEYRGDDKTLPLLDQIEISLQIHDGALIHLFKRSTLRVNMRIKTLDPKEFIITVDTYDTIEDIVELINESGEIPLDTCIELVHEGRRLEHKWTLEDCNMPDDALIYCMVTLKDVSADNRDSGNFTIAQPRYDHGNEYGFEYEYVYMAGWPRTTYQWPYHEKYHKYKQELVPYELPRESVVYSTNNFDLLVKLPNKKTIVVCVKQEHTVEQIKGVIEIEERIPKEEQFLEFQGLRLKDHHKLGHYNIKPGDTVYVSQRMFGSMNIHISSVPLELGVEKLWKVGQVKAMIAERTGKNFLEFDLATEEGLLLKDEKLLRDYDISDHDRLDIVEKDGFHLQKEIAPLSNRYNSLEVSGKEHGFSVPWPATVDRLKFKIEEKTEIDREDLLIVLNVDDEEEMKDDDLKYLKNTEEPLVHFRLKSDEPDNTLTCSVQ